MSRAILVYGESGSGKTTSLRTLDPERTFIVDADRKGLSWRGWKKQYNGTKKNYVQTSSVPTLESIYQKMQGEWADKFDVLVIDGLSTIMVADEMRRFEKEIPNDMAAVIAALKKYEEDDDGETEVKAS